MVLGVVDLWRGPKGRVLETWSSSVAQLVAELSASLGVADIRVIDTQPRPNWLVIDLLVPPDRRLFAKLALPTDDSGGHVKRPRLVPVVGHGQRLRSEAEALKRLADAIPEDDPDLAAVSVVHRQDSPAALVVDFVDGQALSLALGPVRRPLGGESGELLRKAGRWLNLFHSLSSGEGLAYRYPDDVQKWLREVADHVGPRPRRWVALVDALADAVERQKDLKPLLGLHHGDMAARNLMVRHDGRIVGIDAGVEWRAPRSHDLAVFLTDLHLRSPLKVRDQVPGFITGYGYSRGESWTSLIFLAIALVDRYLAWTARVEGGEGAMIRRSVEGVRLGRLADALTARIQERIG